MVFEIAIERRRRRLCAHVPHSDGVAVRCRLGHARHARGAACAPDVLDDQLLAECAGHVIAEDARDYVRRSTCRERHDDGDRPAGIRRLRRQLAREYHKQYSMFRSACAIKETSTFACLAATRRPARRSSWLMAVYRLSSTYGWCRCRPRGHGCPR